MNSSEWSLLAFTLIGQFSAGISLTLTVFLILTPSVSRVNYTQLIRTGLLVAMGAIVIALAVSFLHLSAPLSAIYAMSNLKGSWLSREILLVSLYAASITITTIYWVGMKRDYKYTFPLLLLSTVMGILMVLSMGKLYMIATIPAWDTPLTLISFYIAMLLLGIPFILLMSQYLYKNDFPLKVEKAFLFIIILAVATKLVTQAVDWQNTANYVIGFEPESISAFWKALSWAWVLGIGLVIRKIYPQPHDKPQGSKIYLWAFFFFATAEFASRVIFYSSYFRVGI